jgi:hypothetical protein
MGMKASNEGKVNDTAIGFKFIEKIRWKKNEL